MVVDLRGTPFKVAGPSSCTATSGVCSQWSLTGYAEKMTLDCTDNNQKCTVRCGGYPGQCYLSKGYLQLAAHCNPAHYMSKYVCLPKKTAANKGCSTTQKFVAGKNTEITRDDTTCATCGDGEYKSSPTACTAKKTAANNGCSTTQKFVAGKNSVKIQDDTKCTTCGDGEYKSSPTACTAKKTAANKGCSTTQKFVAGKNSVKIQDDTKCTTCGDGEYKSSPAACTLCSNVKCGASPPQYRTCARDGYACKDQPTCADGQFLKGSSGTNEGTCTACGNNEYKEGTNTETACKPKTMQCNPGLYLTATSTTEDNRCTPCGVNEYNEGTNRAAVSAGSDSHLIATPLLKWAEAEQYCVTKGGHLASIHSADDDADVRAFMQASTTSTYPWIGGISSSVNTASTYTWSDGTSWDYTNPSWSRNDGHPNFVHYYRGGGTWGTLDASSSQHGICRIQGTPPTPPPTHPLIHTHTRTHQPTPHTAMALTCVPAPLALVRDCLHLLPEAHFM